MISYLESHVKTFDKDRYLCTLFAGNDYREALFALYAFNIEISKIAEIVSDPILGFIRFTWWRESIDLIYQNKPRPDEISQGLSKAIKSFYIPKELFDEIIFGYEIELEYTMPESVDKFEEYASKTSGSIFKIAAIILNNNIDIAEQLGITWAYIELFKKISSSMLKKSLMLPEPYLCNDLKEFVSDFENKLNKFDKQELASNFPLNLYQVSAKHYLRIIKRNNYRIANIDLAGKSKIGLQLKLLWKSIMK
jgi:phytoene synthase